MYKILSNSCDLGYAIDVINSFDREKGYLLQGPRNAHSMSSLKINFTLDPLRAIRKIAEQFVANFPLDLSATTVKLTMKLTKQK